MTEDLPDIPLKIPLCVRLRFFLRKWAIRTVRCAIRLATRLQWEWAVYKLMELQRWMGWNFEQ